MPGKKRKGSKKGGPGSRSGHQIPSMMNANGVPTFSAGESPRFIYKTNKRMRTKNIIKGVKKIAQRAKKK